MNPSSQWRLARHLQALAPITLTSQMACLCKAPTPTIQTTPPMPCNAKLKLTVYFYITDTEEQTCVENNHIQQKMSYLRLDKLLI